MSSPNHPYLTARQVGTRGKHSATASSSFLQALCVVDGGCVNTDGGGAGTDGSAVSRASAGLGRKQIGWKEGAGGGPGELPERAAGGGANRACHAVGPRPAGRTTRWLQDDHRLPASLRGRGTEPGVKSPRRTDVRVASLRRVLKQPALRQRRRRRWGAGGSAVPLLSHLPAVS